LSGIASIKAGEEFQCFVLVKSFDVKVTGKNKAFVSAVVADATGKVEAVHWDPTDADLAAYGQDLIEISGKAGTYKNNVQLTVSQVRVVPQDQAEQHISEILPTSPVPMDKLTADLDDYVKLVGSGPLTNMVQQLTSDPYFANCPAASVMHHAYVHGLLEHTLGVARLVIAAAGHGGFSVNIALAGALLHDVGKIYEYSITGRRQPSLKLLGHSLMGCEMVTSVAPMHEVPFEETEQIRHIIASHHGRTEWGAVVEPRTKEAWVVHACDIMDAKLAAGEIADRD